MFLAVGFFLFVSDRCWCWLLRVADRWQGLQILHEHRSSSALYSPRQFSWRHFGPPGFTAPVALDGAWWLPPESGCIYIHWGRSRPCTSLIPDDPYLWMATSLELARSSQPDSLMRKMPDCHPTSTSASGCEQKEECHHTHVHLRVCICT